MLMDKMRTLIHEPSLSAYNLHLDDEVTNFIVDSEADSPSLHLSVLSESKSKFEQVTRLEDEPDDDTRI
jgi:hypothetical protein